MFKSNIWVKIKTRSYYNLLIKLNDIGINIYDNKIYKDYILIKTNIDDYNKIKKYLKSYKVSIYSNTGILKIKDIINKYFVFTITIIISIILLLFINNLVFKIDIKSDNKSIKELVSKELKRNKIGVLRLKKDHKDIELIVKNILNNNKDSLEWLEIKYDGLVMNVYVTEKTKNSKEEDKKYCNIVASKDAKIVGIGLIRGVPLKEINDYVYKNDVIISGIITHNEEIKNVICAKGKVYGEVWYKIHITEPLEEIKKEYTGKNRYNMNVKVNGNTYDIFKSRIDGEKEKEETNLYTLNNFEINLVKEKEYKNNTYKLTEEEGYNKAINDATDKIKLTLDEDEEIILKKVLKKDIFNSTIVLDIFVVTKENIAETIELKEEDIYGGESSE